MNHLGKIFWEYVHGVDAKLSSKFRWIWTSFAQDLTFEALLAGCLGATGLTGLCNRSDRSQQFTSAICIVLALLLPRCDPGLLLRDSLSIAILANLGSRACGDFGI